MSGIRWRHSHGKNNRELFLNGRTDPPQYYHSLSGGLLLRDRDPADPNRPSHDDLGADGAVLRVGYDCDLHGVVFKAFSSATALHRDDRS